MHPIRSRLTTLSALATLTAALMTAAGQQETASPSPSAQPHATASQPGTSIGSSDLAHRVGATLAPPRILDISPVSAALSSRVIEDQDGAHAAGTQKAN
ncbi:hypothetical protein ACWD0J_10175 [Streptomyces sp. NPDC003011]